MDRNGQKPAYDIEEILEEARRMKNGTAAKEAASPPAAVPAPADTEKPSARPAMPSVPAQEPPARTVRPRLVMEQTDEPGEEEPDRPRRGMFGRRKRQDDPAEEPVCVPPAAGSARPVSAAGELEEEDDVRVYVPPVKASVPDVPAGKEESPASVQEPPKVVVGPVVRPAPPMPKSSRPRPLPVEDVTRTRVMPAAPAVPPVSEQPEDPLEEGQLHLDELVDGEEQPDSEAELEARLSKVRQEKMEHFARQRLGEPGGFKLAGEEEENDPAEEAEEYEEVELEDYTSYADTEAVQAELSYRRRTGWIVLALTGILEGLLLWLTVMTFITPALPIDPTWFLSIHLFVLGVMLVLNHRMVGGGIAGLFRFKADADSAVSLASFVSFLHTALQFANIDALAAGRVPLMTGVAGLGILLGAAGKQMRISRICENFRFVSHPGEKYAARLIEDPHTAAEIGRPAVAIGEPEVAYFRRSGFLSHFLEHSYEPDVCDRVMRVFVPLVTAAAVVVSVLYAVMNGAASWMHAVTLFCGMVCLSAPVAAVTAANLPLLRAAKKSLRWGGMLSGWKAVELFGDPHALAVDALELFPSESVLLHGIKTFSGARIDEAILDAASVTIRAGGPLSSVFRRVIENKVDILQEVDTLVYEQDMGLSGWVNGRRVLVGSRRLLENHGVDVPSRDYEGRYAKDGRKLVYLSIGGELSAMFVISYVGDEGMARALRGLTKREITLLVRTCDPNVTEELICSVYDLDPYYVEVLGATAGRSYSGLVKGCEPESEAVLASNGRLEGMADSLAHCSRLRTGAVLAVVLQVIGGVLGLALGIYLAFRSGQPFPPLYSLAYLMSWTVLTWLFPIILRKS